MNNDDDDSEKKGQTRRGNRTRSRGIGVRSDGTPGSEDSIFMHGIRMSRVEFAHLQRRRERMGHPKKGLGAMADGSEAMRSALLAAEDTTVHMHYVQWPAAMVAEIAAVSNEEDLMAEVVFAEIVYDTTGREVFSVDHMTTRLCTPISESVSEEAVRAAMTRLVKEGLLAWTPDHDAVIDVSEKLPETAMKRAKDRKARIALRGPYRFPAPS